MSIHKKERNVDTKLTSYWEHKSFLKKIVISRSKPLAFAKSCELLLFKRIRQAATRNENTVNDKTYQMRTESKKQTKTTKPNTTEGEEHCQSKYCIE